MNFNKKIKSVFSQWKMKMIVKKGKNLENMQNLKLEEIRQGVRMMNLKIDAIARFLKVKEANRG